MNDKQRRFANEYCVDLNCTQAAVRAGYNARSASSQGFDLLQKPEVAALVQRIHKGQLDRASIRAENVLAELAQIAFSDIRALLAEDGSVQPIHALSDEAAASIASIEVTTSKDGVTKVSRIKTWDKVRALEQLCRHLGLLKPDQHQHVHAVVHFSPEQLQAMSDQQLAKVEQAYAELSAVSAQVSPTQAQVSPTQV